MSIEASVPGKRHFRRGGVKPAWAARVEAFFVRHRRDLVFHQNESTDLVFALVGLAGRGHDHYEIGRASAGNEFLHPVDLPLFARLARFRFDSARIAARVWLGQGPGADPFSARQAREVFLFLFLRAEAIDLAGKIAQLYCTIPRN